MKKQLLTIIVLMTATTLYQTQAQTIKLWGLTYAGASNGVGNIFKCTATGTITDTCDFNRPGIDAQSPIGTLIKAYNGLLYGMTENGGNNGDGAIFSYNTLTNKETDVHSFGNGNDGQSPYNGSLLQVNDSVLYGMTEYGGAYSYGVIFSYNIISGVETDVHNFGSGQDGTYPYGSLIKASNGLLYGMTYGGGTLGYGTIFRYNISTGNDSVLYNFGGVADGYHPYGNLTQVSDSVLYGMTSQGGAHGEGIIFSYSILTGNETDKYDFYVNGLDAGVPYGSLLIANNGLLYGMTYEGGDDEGTIFSFNVAKDSEKVLHIFGNNYDGAYPYGDLIQASNGLLYGLTQEGGANDQGIMFSYDINSGTETDIHDFADSSGDEPYGDLLEDDTTTGINQLTVESGQLTVYPNPTSGIITISSIKNINSITVTNLVGQIILKSSYSNMNKQTIDLGEFSSGMYFITVASGDETITQKIILDK